MHTILQFCVQSENNLFLTPKKKKKKELRKTWELIPCYNTLLFNFYFSSLICFTITELNSRNVHDEEVLDMQYIWIWANTSTQNHGDQSNARNKSVFLSSVWYGIRSELFLKQVRHTLLTTIKDRILTQGSRFVQSIF